jgi:hypothetical protein
LITDIFSWRCRCCFAFHASFRHDSYCFHAAIIFAFWRFHHYFSPDILLSSMTPLSFAIILIFRRLLPLSLLIFSFRYHTPLSFVIHAAFPVSRRICRRHFRRYTFHYFQFAISCRCLMPFAGFGLPAMMPLLPRPPAISPSRRRLTPFHFDYAISPRCAIRHTLMSLLPFTRC